MATFNQAFEKDATFIFGSWVCTADGAGGWNRYLKPDEEKKTEASNINDLTENLDEIQLSDLVRGHEYESRPIRTLAQTLVALFDSDSTPSTSLITLPSQPMIGLYNAATVYQEAMRTQFESALGSNHDP